ncbi:MAG: addiction module protein [Desulfobacterales bacterium]|nr:addiction module protein [Desulfobacterales bacterium]
MIDKLRELPVHERIQLVEDLWDSIAVDQSVLPVTEAQAEELDKRLAAYRADGIKGRSAELVISDIRKRL